MSQQGAELFSLQSAPKGRSILLPRYSIMHVSISVPEASEVQNKSLGFIYFILWSILHEPKGSVGEPDTWGWLGTLPSSLQSSGEFGASELTCEADSGLLEVNERNSLLIEGGLDQPSALWAIFLEAPRTWPKLRKTPRWLPSALDQILCMSWISVMP